MLHRLAAQSGIDGVLVLACYGEDPATRRKISSVERFSIGGVDSMVDAITAKEPIPHLNVYAPWHIMRHGLTGNERGGLRDLRAILALPVDLDSDTGKVGALPLEAPYVLETSEDNYQPFYLLAQALSPEEAQPIAEGLQVATGSDHGTKDLAHVWRVPGTLNWPNRKKLERGRSPDPQPVRVSKPWVGELIVPEKLEKAVAAYRKPANDKTKDHDAGGGAGSEPFMALPASLKKLIASPPLPDEDRSAVAASVIFGLMHQGWNDAQIAEVIQANPQGVGARYIQGSDLEADTKRLRIKFNEKREQKAQQPGKLVYTSAEFVAELKPPSYVWSGIVQRGFIYSLTAPTGAGKTALGLLFAASVDRGKALAGRKVKQGTALYLCAENPDDVRMRWIAQTAEFELTPEDMGVRFVPGTQTISMARPAIEKEIAGLELGAVLVDTSSAFFEGADENDNVLAGKHARMLRELTTLPGRPVVLVLCHPTKNAAAENLQPRGGGAFIAEMDGNLVCSKDDPTVELHWQGKFRGPDFAPILFRLKPATHHRLVDDEGTLIPTIVIQALSEPERREMAREKFRAEDEVLVARGELIKTEAEVSPTSNEVAQHLGWIDAAGSPQGWKVRRLDKALKAAGLLKDGRAGIVLTEAGKKAMDAAKRRATG
jgi:hypothetical protein